MSCVGKVFKGRESEKSVCARRETTQIAHDLDGDIISRMISLSFAHHTLLTPDAAASGDAINDDVGEILSRYPPSYCDWRWML